MLYDVMRDHVLLYDEFGIICAQIMQLFPFCVTAVVTSCVLWRLVKRRQKSDQTLTESITDQKLRQNEVHFYIPC